MVPAQTLAKSPGALFLHALNLHATSRLFGQHASDQGIGDVVRTDPAGRSSPMCYHSAEVYAAEVAAAVVRIAIYYNRFRKTNIRHILSNLKPETICNTISFRN